ncbi:ArsR/SmtB family transcription factor [Actinacidiphila epipremni]|uniref:Winged helix-turn-helix transcriptional regulator n=1 Tax=Actinacidiphila epipremni TaxID=2053013 RepID=A0ABX0ZG78_9ACTN|nr:winged helix-turn-helix domain-containing protein [Actinacidiphila epipremni]NJP42815.1 winged helix-turn-helix transcriptional regulator [Actinacidiphila epipremni]
MRIHFTLTDLARTRLAGRPSPLAVTTFSAFRLAQRVPPPGLDGWRRLVRAGLTAPRAGAAAAPGPGGKPPRPGYFAQLAPSDPAHPVPRFLRPHVGLETLEDELERLMGTPPGELRADLEYVGRHRPLPGWARDLAAGDPATAARLASAVRDYHRVAVAPYWRGLTALLAADRAARTKQLGDGGIERVLDGLGPRFRWRPPVLEVRTTARSEYDYHLGGRGLVLAPGAFSGYVPCDPDEEQPTLYYEVPPDSAGAPLIATPNGAAAGPYDGLAALLGHSRAAVLEVIADGVTTGQLARRVGLSPASASEHASVLRRAGLVATRRAGRSSHHSLTALGTDLLLAAAAWPNRER